VSGCRQIWDCCLFIYVLQHTVPQIVIFNPAGVPQNLFKDLKIALNHKKHCTKVLLEVIKLKINMKRSQQGYGKRCIKKFGCF
jgi:hypothetical protein